MISRIASYDNYKSVVTDLSRTQVKIDNNQEELASGKRVETAGDDPFASIVIQNAKQEQKEIQTYLSNIALANNRLSNEESVIANTEEMTSAFKKRCLQVLNGALSLEDREAYSQEMAHYADEIYGLSNSRDESGNYIFAGGRTSSPAFVRDNDGTITFKGDTNVPKATISSTVTLTTRDSGRNVFYSENPFGDFQPDYELQDGSMLTLKHAQSSIDEPSNFTLIFSENPDTKEIRYELWDKETYESQLDNPQAEQAKVETASEDDSVDSDTIVDAAGTAVSTVAQVAAPITTVGTEATKAAVNAVQAIQTGPLMSGVFHAGEGIVYQPSLLDSEQELIIELEGYPIQDGDRIDLDYEPKIDIFEVMRDGIRESASDDNDATRTAQMNTIVREMDSSFVHFNEIRSDIGSKLQTLDTQQSMLQDMDIELEKMKGALEDLDYTAAVIDYSKNTTALQAAQNAFSKTQQLSLFQYI